MKIRLQTAEGIKNGSSLFCVGKLESCSLVVVITELPGDHLFMILSQSIAPHVGLKAGCCIKRLQIDILGLPIEYSEEPKNEMVLRK
jgi:hypothetical protein